MYTVLQMFNRTSLVLVGHTDILNAPLCVWAALRCLAPGPTWHHASVNWPDWLSLSFDFSDCFYYSLTFNFLQLWWESGENEFKAHEERNRKAFYSVLKRERFFFAGNYPIKLSVSGFLRSFGFNLISPWVRSVQGITSHPISNLPQWQVPRDQ